MPYTTHRSVANLSTVTDFSNADHDFALLIGLILYLIKTLFLYVSERAVANTMVASQMAIGYQNRHGFIISIANSRKRLGKRVTKGDFEKMLHNPDDLTDDEDY